MKKIVITFILLIGMAFTSYAQSDKVKAKATEKVEQLNNEIAAADETLTLSDEQKAKIHQIHVDRIMAVRKANKSGASDEEKKSLQKEYFQKIYKEVLTKEQLKARRAGKKKLKG